MPLDVIHRYRPIIDLLRAVPSNDGFNSILEVGSGSGGLSQFIEKGKIVNCDIVVGPHREDHAVYVTGSSDKLPFQEGSFGCVISVDMLEHVENVKRRDVVSEMLRVSKNTVVLAFPHGAKSCFYEKIFMRIYELFGIDHQWLREHCERGLPDVNTITGYIAQLSPNSRIKVKDNVNAFVWFLTVCIGMLMLLTGKIFRVKVKTYMKMFGWTTKYVNFGDCYRKIIVIEK